MKIPFQTQAGPARAGRWLAAASLGFAPLAFAIAESRAQAAPDVRPQARVEVAYVLSPAQQYGLALEAQTEQDYEGLLRWLRASAGGGHLPAQELLGVVLLGGPSLYGDAVPADFCEARKWLRQAAVNGGSASVPRALMGRPHGHGPTTACQ